MLLHSQMKQPGVDQEAKESDLNDPLWRDRVGLALSHGMQAAIQLGQQAVTAGAMDAPWLRFNGDVHTSMDFGERSGHAFT
jgi:hypothetical protein